MLENEINSFGNSVVNRQMTKIVSIKGSKWTVILNIAQEKIKDLNKNQDNLY